MSQPPRLPCLRPLEPIPLRVGEEHQIAWRDPLGLTPTIQVPHAVAVLMSLLDGKRELAELRAVWLQMAGEDLPAEFLSRLLGELDDLGLLDSPRFREKRATALADFRRAGVRPMAHCEGGYPATRFACAAYLDRFLGPANGAPRTKPVRGLVAPHIDLGRGGAVYGQAYRLLRDSAADLFIVLGIAHSSSCWPEPPPLATFTRLHFATPFGEVETDRAFVDRVVDAYGRHGDADELFRDELVHRDEHSLEFQMLFLKHVRGDRPCRVVPILLGSLHEFYARPAAVGGERGLGPLLAALQSAIAAHEGEVCLIAGADLAHVGPRFGAETPVDPDAVARIRRRDGEALRLLEQDGAAWFGHFAADGNARNVCSVSNLWLLRALLPEAGMELVGYDVAFDPEQTVSFAAAAFR